MAEHQHESKCWKRYEPCGEHHAHTYNCGGGELGPKCPEYIPPAHRAPVQPQHIELAREWRADWARHHQRWKGRPNSINAYAQGCADQEERTKEETIEHVAAAFDAKARAATTEILSRFWYDAAATLRNGSWEPIQ